jgi:uncharacterized phage protein (predicted DNA packaging)
MKVSEITIQDLKEYAHVYHFEDDNLFTSILVACKSYIKSYTGLSTELMDTKEDLTIALFVLANEMYGNRIYTVENDKVNTVIKSILDMHSVNLL